MEKKKLQHKLVLYQHFPCGKLMEFEKLALAVVSVISNAQIPVRSSPTVNQNLKIRFRICMGPIITRGLYTFYPLLEDNFFVFKEVFQENSVFKYG